MLQITNSHGRIEDNVYEIVRTYRGNDEVVMIDELRVINRRLSELRRSKSTDTRHEKRQSLSNIKYEETKRDV
jgi:hypothetical protein